jgi:hypothetical protein
VTLPCKAWLGRRLPSINRYSACGAWLSPEQADKPKADKPAAAVAAKQAWRREAFKTTDEVMVDTRTMKKTEPMVVSTYIFPMTT